MTATGDSMKLEKAARRRLNDFERKYGKKLLHLAYHAALPVALNADLLHLLRINFFLDPPESLLYTAEVDLLFAPFCHEIGEGLYEIEADARDLLLQGLAQEYGWERMCEVATLLFQYNEHSSPWASRTGLQRAQQLTVLNFLDPSEVRQWLAEAETWVGQGPSAEREWFVAMSKEIERERETVSFAYEQKQGDRAVPIPALLIAGPPHAGKSVLANSLTQALRGRGVLHHLLRATPDGEGNWMQDADQETIRLFRVKGTWTETFIEGICRDIERRQYPFIVDLGGRAGEAQLPILRRCTHALLLLRSDQEENTQSWRDLVEQEGLLPVARIYSALKGITTITSLEPLIQGTLVGLERGKLAQGPLFDALVDRITSLFVSHSSAELTKWYLETAPVEMVIDLGALLRTRFPQSEGWNPEMLVDLLAELPTDTPVAVYGVGPNWLYAAMAAHIHPQQFYLFDPRIGWVSPPVLQISLRTTPEIQVEVREEKHFTVLWVDIPKKYLDYAQSELLSFPPIPSARGLIIYGMIPNWLLTAIVRLYYEAEVGWIACYPPQLSGAVVVASRISDHVLGELIPLSPSIPQSDVDESPEALSEIAETSRGRLVVQPNFELVALAPVSESLLADLDRFAERVRLEHIALYRLSKASATRAFQLGLTAEVIVQILGQAAGGDIPQNVHYSLQEWERQARRSELLRGATLLEVDDPSLIGIGLSSELYNRCRTILLACEEFQSDENLRSVFVTSGLEAFRNRMPEASNITDRIDRCLSFLLDKQWEGEYLLLPFIEALRDRYHQEDAMHATLDALGRDIRSAMKAAPTVGHNISTSDYTRETLSTMESQSALFVPESLHRLGFVGRTINGYDVIIPPVVAVPAGLFLMGSNKQSDPLASIDEQPQHQVSVAAYQIGKYPLTVAEYACAVRARVINEPSQKPSPGSDRDWQTQLSRLDHPVINVPLHDFVTYARWLADLTGVPWRLPTEAEWEKAARGTQGYIYPWGNLWNQLLANTSETGRGATTSVGAYPGGASSYGALDMAGNVWEITATVWGFPYPYRPDDGRNDAAAQAEHVLRGGAWYLPSKFARASCRYTTRRPMDTFGTRLARG